MAEVNGNIAVPGGQIGSGEAQVFNPAPTLQLLAQMQERADNQAKLDALAKMKQQEAEAKAKEVKPLDYPEFDVAGKGGLFNMKWAEERKKRHSAGLDAFSNAKTDVERSKIISDIRNIDAGENAMLEAQKERFYKTSEDLQKQGYNFDPDREAYEITQTSNLFDPTLNSRLIEKVKTNPNTFNYAQIGTEAEKLAGAVQEGTVDEQGRRMERKRAKFMRPSKSNPYIDEISVTDAVPILLQTPAGREQFPILVNQSLKKQGIDPLTIQGKDVSELTDVEKAAYLKAQKEAIEPYFKGRGDYSFVQDFTTEEGKAKQKKIGETTGDIISGNAAITRDIRYKEVNTGEIRRIKGFVGDVEQKEIRKGQPVELSANKNVFILGGGGAETKELIKKAFMENNDGSWNTKFGGSVRNWAKFKEPVFMLVKPTTITVMEKGQRVDVVRPAGTVLTKAEGLRTKASYPNNVRESEAYILSPTKLQSVSSDDPDVADVFKNPAFKDIEIIIPITEANEFAPYHKTKLPSW